MLANFNHHPWTRVAVIITGAIKRYSFHMVTHSFNYNNPSEGKFESDLKKIKFKSDLKKHQIGLILFELGFLPT